MTRIIKPNSDNLIKLKRNFKSLKVTTLPDQFVNPILLNHDKSDDYYRYSFDDGETVSILKTLKDFLPSNLRARCYPNSNEEFRLVRIPSNHFYNYLRVRIGEVDQWIFRRGAIWKLLTIARRFTPPMFPLDDPRLNKEDASYFPNAAMLISNIRSKRRFRKFPRENLYHDIHDVDGQITFFPFPFKSRVINRLSPSVIKLSEQLSCTVFFYRTYVKRERKRYLSFGLLFNHSVMPPDFEFQLTLEIDIRFGFFPLTTPSITTFHRHITNDSPTIGYPLFHDWDDFKRKAFDKFIDVHLSFKIGLFPNLDPSPYNRNLEIFFEQDAENYPQLDFEINCHAKQMLFDILHHGSADLTYDNIVSVYKLAVETNCKHAIEYCGRVLQTTHPINKDEIRAHRVLLEFIQKKVMDKSYLQDYINTMNHKNPPQLDDYL